MPLLLILLATKDLLRDELHEMLLVSTCFNHRNINTEAYVTHRKFLSGLSELSTGVVQFFLQLVLLFNWTLLQLL